MWRASCRTPWCTLSSPCSWTTGFRGDRSAVSGTRYARWFCSCTGNSRAAAGSVAGLR
uniref:Uncharacterized protein n=1 Tax=Anguilla anguilla TaxID=7936 RepID=A0A0E9Q2U9_ANGAN